MRTKHVVFESPAVEQDPLHGIDTAIAQMYVGQVATSVVLRHPHNGLPSVYASGPEGDYTASTVLATTEEERPAQVPAARTTELDQPLF